MLLGEPDIGLLTQTEVADVARQVCAAVPDGRKRLHEVIGATHYYTGPDGRQHLAEAIGVVDDFLSSTFA